MGGVASGDSAGLGPRSPAGLGSVAAAPPPLPTAAAPGAGRAEPGCQRASPRATQPRAGPGPAGGGSGHPGPEGETGRGSEGRGDRRRRREPCPDCREPHERGARVTRRPWGPGRTALPSEKGAHPSARGPRKSGKPRPRRGEGFSNIPLQPVVWGLKVKWGVPEEGRGGHTWLDKACWSRMQACVCVCVWRGGGGGGKDTAQDTGSRPC